jgi:hypothetical protein
MPRMVFAVSAAAFAIAIGSAAVVGREPRAAARITPAPAEARR